MDGLLCVGNGRAVGVFFPGCIILLLWLMTYIHTIALKLMRLYWNVAFVFLHYQYDLLFIVSDF